MPMTGNTLKISHDQEIAILRFWAQAMDIARTFRDDEIRSVPGLAAAIEAARPLPDAIGWGGEEDSAPARTPRTRTAGGQNGNAARSR